MTRGRVQDIGAATAAVGRRQDGVVCETVCTAAAEHKGVDAHSHVASLRLDALPNKHASSVQAVYRTWFRADLVACNIRGRAEFRIVFVIGGEKAHLHPSTVRSFQVHICEKSGRGQNCNWNSRIQMERHASRSFGITRNTAG